MRHVEIYFSLDVRTKESSNACYYFPIGSLCNVAIILIIDCILHFYSRQLSFSFQLVYFVVLSSFIVACFVTSRNYIVAMFPDICGEIVLLLFFCRFFLFIKI